MVIHKCVWIDLQGGEIRTRQCRRCLVRFRSPLFKRLKFIVIATVPPISQTVTIWQIRIAYHNAVSCHWNGFCTVIFIDFPTFDQNDRLNAILELFCIFIPQRQRNSFIATDIEDRERPKNAFRKWNSTFVSLKFDCLFTYKSSINVMSRIFNSLPVVLALIVCKLPTSRHTPITSVSFFFSRQKKSE